MGRPQSAHNWRRGSHFPDGASRDRTGDLLLAKQALSQLSYGPSRWMNGGRGTRCAAPGGSPATRHGACAVRQEQLADPSPDPVYGARLAPVSKALDAPQRARSRRCPGSPQRRSRDRCGWPSTQASRITIPTARRDRGSRGAAARRRFRFANVLSAWIEWTTTGRSPAAATTAAGRWGARPSRSGR